MDEQPPTIGQRVRELRLRRGMTQQRLAQASGVTRISYIETGRITQPGACTIDALAVALDVAMADLDPDRFPHS